MRLLALVTDAFGGRGGIAKFNRDLLRAVCQHDECEQVVALPRVIVEPPTDLPAKLVFCEESARGKLSFLLHTWRQARAERLDGVICGHLGLLPIAALAASLQRVPLLLVVHGVEAWRHPRRAFLSRSLKRVDALISVSQVTQDRFLAWAAIRPTTAAVIPNCVDATRFTPGPRNASLLAKYALAGRTVLLTVGRLSASERYKGVDEVLEVLPQLARRVPSVSYLVVGDGDDRSRLELKASELGVRERVVFAGHVPEPDKVDHFRLADAFVMPGRGEGFGIVYLEALACGVPVVASTADASREAVLNGKLGELANPDRPEEIESAIVRALSARERAVPPELEHFSAQRFAARWHGVLDHVFRDRIRFPTGWRDVPADAAEMTSASTRRESESADAAARAHY